MAFAAPVLGLMLLTVGVLRYRAATAPQPPVPTDLATLEPILGDRLRTAIQTAREQPRDGETHGQLGVLYEAHGFDELALLSYGNAISVDADEPRWRYLWANLTAVGGDPERAEAAYRDVIAAAPEYAPACERLGLLLIDRQAYAEADVAFRRVTQLRPAEPQGYVGIAKTELALNRYASAVEWLEKALARMPAHAEAHYLLGQAYQRLGRSKEAAVELARGGDALVETLHDPWRSAIPKARVTLTARLEMAADFIAQGRADQALPILEAVLKRKPDNVTALNNLSIAYLRLDRVDDAQRILNRALRMGRDHYAIRDNLARVLMKKGKLQAALEQTEKAIRLAPTLGRLFFTRGTIFARLGDDEAGVEAFRRAAQLDARNPDVYLNLGGLLGRLDRWEEARAAFENAVAFKPQSVDAHYYLGTANHRTDRLEQARDCFQAALSIDPEDVRVAHELKRLQADLKRRSR